MSIHAERLKQAATAVKATKQLAEDLARNYIRDWVREGVKGIQASTEVAVPVAVASGPHMLYDHVEVLCELLDTDAAGLARKANNELISLSAGQQLEVIVDKSFPCPILRFAVPARAAARS